MITACVLGVLLAVPQLAVEPARVAAGDAVTLRVVHGGAPQAGVVVQVEPPAGAGFAAPATDAAGRSSVATVAAGRYVFRADVDGVRLFAVAHAEARGSRWGLAAACVPLGLALLWRELSRARDRRGRPRTADPGCP